MFPMSRVGSIRTGDLTFRRMWSVFNVAITKKSSTHMPRCLAEMNKIARLLLIERFGPSSGEMSKGKVMLARPCLNSAWMAKSRSLLRCRISSPNSTRREELLVQKGMTESRWCWIANSYGAMPCSVKRHAPPLTSRSRSTRFGVFQDTATDPMLKRISFSSREKWLCRYGAAR